MASVTYTTAATGSHMDHNCNSFATEPYAVGTYEWNSLCPVQEQTYNHSAVGAFHSPSESCYDYDYSEHSDRSNSPYNFNNFNNHEFDSSIDGYSSASSNNSGYPSPALSDANSPSFHATELDVSALTLLPNNSIQHSYFDALPDHPKDFHLASSHIINQLSDPSDAMFNEMLTTPLFSERKSMFTVPKLDSIPTPSIQVIEPSPLSKSQINFAELDRFIVQQNQHTIKLEPDDSDECCSEPDHTLYRRHSSPIPLPVRGVSPSNGLVTPPPNAVPSLPRRKSAVPYAQLMNNINLAPPRPRKMKQNSPYKCPTQGCEKTFTRPYNLKSHMRTHTAERPYPCSFPGCDKTFSRQHDRNRHAKLHLGIKPYVCQNCSKAFARQDALNRHLRVENGPCALALQNQTPKFKPVVM